MLMLLDRLEPDCADVIERRAKSDRLGDRLRSRLVLVRKLAPGRLLHFHLADHVTAEVERLHLLEQLRASPKGAHAARAAQLVRREREEVAVECLYVDGAMRCG